MILVICCLNNKNKQLMNRHKSMKTRFQKTITFILLIISFNAFSQQENLFDWKFETGGDILGGAIISDNMVYIGSHDSIFYALDTLGNKVWQFNSHYAIQSTPVVKDSIVCLHSGNRLYGLNKLTGEQIWKHEPEEVSGKTPTISNYSTDLKSSSPVLKESNVYYGNEYGRFYGINIYTGEEVFKYQTEKAYHIRSTANIINDTAYFGDDEGYVYAISLKDSSLIWEVRTNDGTKPYGGFAPVVGELKVYENLLYFGILNGEFQVLNRFTGASEWSVGDKFGSWYSGIPLIKNGILYLGTSDEKTFKAFDALTGSLIWSKSVQRGVYNACTFLEDFIIVLSGYGTYEDLSTEKGSGRLTVLDHDGNVLNRISLNGSVFNTPAYSNGKLYFGSRDNHVYCLTVDKVTKNAEAVVNFENPLLDYGLIDSESILTIDLPTIYNAGSKMVVIELIDSCKNIPDDGVLISPATVHVNAQDSAKAKIRIYPSRIENGEYSVSYFLKPVDGEENNFLFSNEVTFSIEIATSIRATQETSSDISFYPNPFTDVVKLKIESQTDENVRVEFYAVNGSVLMNKTFMGVSTGNVKEINLSEFTRNNEIIFYRISINEKEYRSGSLIIN